VKDQDRKRLMDLAKISVQDQLAIANLYHLGVTINKGKKAKKETKKKKKRGDVPYELSRYVPNLKDVLKQLAEDGLSAQEYPFVRDDPNVTTGRAPSSSSGEKKSLKGAAKGPKWADKGKKKEENKVQLAGPRIIVFILGGMTFSEMRTAYEITSQHQRLCFVGSTHIITPNKFLADLGRLAPDNSASR